MSETHTKLDIGATVPDKFSHFVQCVFPSALCVLRRPLNSSQLQQHTSPTKVNISSGQRNLLKKFLVYDKKIVFDIFGQL